MTAHRAILEELYAVGVAAAQPRALVEEAIGPLYDGGAIPGRVAVLAIGKAAPTMAEAAVELLTRRGASVTGGLVVSGSEGRSPHPAIVRVAGDHPLPGSASRRAAAMLTDATRRARDEADTALVLVSGGATSLVGSPVPGLSMEVLTTLFEGLLRSGWDIGEMNA